MSYKVLCPFHKEVTPSCVVYSDHFKCFGCGRHGPISELPGNYSYTPAAPLPRTDVRAEIARIKALPTKAIRGLELPYDSKGYYIVWPDESYYKIRLYDETSRYRSPVGATKTAFRCLGINDSKMSLPGNVLVGDRPLYIVEGEINALSLAKVLINSDIVSPGSATDFDRFEPDKNYSRYTIIVDEDAPGVIAAIKLKSKILAFCPLVDVVLMGDGDLNDWLQKYDKETFQQKVAALLGM